MSQVKVGDAVYDFDFANPSNREAMAIERVFDGTFKQWAEAVKNGSITALTCLVYVLEKRDNPSLKFSDVEFSIGSFDVEEDDTAAGDTETEEVVEQANPTDAEPPPSPDIGSAV